MVISTVSTLALYCSRCGKIEMHDISRFAFKQAGRRQLKCGCGQILATIVSAHHTQCLLEVPCVVCETAHLICVNSKNFWRTDPDRLYCPQTNMELGLIGDRNLIEQTVADQKHGCESIHCETACDEFIGNPQIMFEILNKVHDIAEKGGVFCSCGNADIEAQVGRDCIELICGKCGGHRTIPAGSEADLLRIASLETIELAAKRCTTHKS